MLPPPPPSPPPPPPIQNELIPTTPVNPLIDSVTPSTDIEDTPPPIDDHHQHELETIKSNPHSRSNSHSYSLAMNVMFTQQKQYQIKNGLNMKKKSTDYYSMSPLLNPLAAPNHDDIDDLGDEHFHKILVNFTRQESRSRDQSRSISKTSKWRRPSPNRASNKFKLKKTRKNQQKQQKSTNALTPVPIASNDNDNHTLFNDTLPSVPRQATRKRRANTSQLTSSPINTTMNAWNNNINIVNTRQTAIPPPPSEPHPSLSPNNNNKNKQPKLIEVDEDDDDDDSLSLSPEPGTIYRTAPNMNVVSQGMSVPIDHDENTGDNEIPSFNAYVQSDVTTINQRESKIIGNNMFKPPIHRGQSTPHQSLGSYEDDPDDIDLDGLNMDIDDILDDDTLRSPLISSNGSYDDDGNHLVTLTSIDLFDSENEASDNGDDEKKQEIIPSEIAFRTAAQQLLISCGNSKEVFSALRKICTDLKKDNLLPIKLDCNGKILKYQQVELFLTLLGFKNNLTNNTWECDINDRTKSKLIDVAILECHKCYMTIKNEASTLVLIKQQRQRSVNSANGHQIRSSLGIPPLSSLPPPPPPQHKTLIINMPMPVMKIIESRSYEEYITSDGDDDDDNINGDSNDRVQLYELIWSISHHNHTDYAAADILMLCYPLVTTPKQLLICCEQRVFRNDHDGRTTTTSISTTTTTTTTNGSSGHISLPSSSTISITSPNLSKASSTEISSSSSHLSFPSSMIGSVSSDHMVNSLHIPHSNLYERVLSSFSVQAKVIAFLRDWMNKYWVKDWEPNSKLIAYARQFIKRYKKAVESDNDMDQHEYNKALLLIGMLQKTMNVQKKKQSMKLNKVLGNSNSQFLSGNSSPTKKRKSTGGRGFSKMILNNKNHKKSKSKFGFAIGGSKHDILPKDVLSVDHIVLAEQITLLQFKLFQKIHSRECLNQSWKKKEKKYLLAPNITQYIDEFNKITKWIQGSVLLAGNVKQRGKVLKRWVKVEEILYDLRNFQALFAVHCALSSTPLYRLKDAWSFVADKHVKQHMTVKVIMKSTANWRNLRRLQVETHPPMLPYFGMFAQDLIVLEETTKNRKRDGAINWDALWRLNKAIDKHLIYQNSPYDNIQQDATIQRWMNQELDMAFKLDDEWIYMVSSNVMKADEKEMGKNSYKNKKSNDRHLNINNHKRNNKKNKNKNKKDKKKRTKSFGVWGLGNR